MEVGVAVLEAPPATGVVLPVDMSSRFGPRKKRAAVRLRLGRAALAFGRIAGKEFERFVFGLGLVY